MASYSVRITRGLRFSANRKANNEVVTKRGLKFLAKRKRDEWVQNFNGGGGGSGGMVRRKIRFRFS